MGELIQPGEASEDCLEFKLCGTSGRRELCIVHCHSCHIYGIWRRKEVGVHFKVIIWDGN